MPDFTTLTGRSVTPEELNKKQIQLPTKEQLVRYGGGYGGEIAVGEAGKYAGSTAGLLGGPFAPVTVPIGYVIGGLSGGFGGSVARQKLTRPDEPISYGEATADALINLIPFDEIFKGGKVATKVAKSAVTGTGVGVGGVTVEKAIDEKRLPTQQELLERGISGATLASGLGIAQHKLSKMLGKSSSEVDALIKAGDKDAISLRNAIDSYVIREADFKTMLSQIAPTQVLDRKQRQIVREAPLSVKGAQAEAAWFGEKIQAWISKQPDPVKANLQVEDIMMGKGNYTSDMKPINKDLTKARERIEEFQKKAIENHYSGVKVLPDETVRTLEKSLNSGDYLTREYRFFIDPEYQPPKGSRERLMGVLNETMGADEAKIYMQHLQDARMGLETFGTPTDSIFKHRKDISPELASYLGHVSDSGERVRGTLDRLSKATLYNKADDNIRQQAQIGGISRFAQEVEGQKGFVPLKLRRGYQTDPETGQQLYVPDYYQEALNTLYAKGIDETSAKGFEKWIPDLYETMVSASKASKVLANPPSYAINYPSGIAQLMGMGMNPFKGFNEGWQTALTEIGPRVRKHAFEALGDDAMGQTKRAKELGLLQGSVLESDIRGGLKKGAIGGSFEKVSGPLGKIYNIPDNMFRVIAWKQQQDTLEKLFPLATREQLERRAADDVLDMFQNYDRLPSQVKYLSRKGVLGQFSAFPIELGRNMFNQGKHIKDLMSGQYAAKYQDDMGGLFDYRKARLEGAKRLAAASMMTGGIALGISQYNKNITGLSSDEQDALKRSVLPEWDKDKLVMFLPAKDGEYKYIDMSYLVPQQAMVSVFHSGLKGEDMLESLDNVRSSIFNEIGGEGTFIMQNAAAAIANRDDEGKPIAKGTDATGQTLDKLGFFIDRSFRPGFLREFEKFQKDPSQAMLRQAGIRVRDQKLETGINFKTKEYKANFDAIRSSMSKARYLGNRQMFEESSKEHLENFQSLQQNIKDYQTLGMDEDELIQKVGSKVGRSMVIQAIDNEYEQPVFERPISGKDLYEQYSAYESPEERKLWVGSLQPQEKALLRQTYERMQKTASLSEREKYVKSLGVSDGERARYIVSKANLLDGKGARKYLEKLASKRIISKDVLAQIIELKRIEDERNQLLLDNPPKSATLPK